MWWWRARISKNVVSNYRFYDLYVCSLLFLRVRVPVCVTISRFPVCMYINVHVYVYVFVLTLSTAHLSCLANVTSQMESEGEIRKMKSEFNEPDS